MKTTIISLFFLSSVCFFPQLGNSEILPNTFDALLQSQDTTTIEYWKQQVKKWKSEAEIQRKTAEENAMEAVDIMTFAQRNEMRANRYREMADSNAVVAIQMEKEALRQKDLAVRNEARAINAERQATLNAADARLEHQRAVEQTNKWESRIKELKEVIEEQKKEIEELRKKIKN